MYRCCFLFTYRESFVKDGLKPPAGLVWLGDKRTIAFVAMRPKNPPPQPPPGD